MEAAAPDRPCDARSQHIGSKLPCQDHGKSARFIQSSSSFVNRGVPAGKLVDKVGTHKAIVAGLVIMLASASQLWPLAQTLGTAGYLMAITTLTAGYGLFQAANSTAVVTAASSVQRGVVSGLLSLSRNLGLITGASVMGAVFVAGVGTEEVLSAGPHEIAGGLRLVFGVAVALILVAILLSLHTARTSATGETLVARWRFRTPGGRSGAT
jgi:MFS family permease